MNKNGSIAIVCILASVSLMLLYSNTHSLAIIYVGILLALISLGIAIFKIVLKEKNTKLISFLAILLIGILFIAFGLFV